MSASASRPAQPAPAAPGGSGGAPLPPPKLLSVGKAARRAGVSRWTIRRWVLDRRLRAHRLPSGRLAIDPADLALAMPWAW